MDVTDVTCTCWGGGAPSAVCAGVGGSARSIPQSTGESGMKETSPTLRAGTVPAAVMRTIRRIPGYRALLETAPTVNATYGMGGNNQPFVVETPKTLKIRSGCEGGGKGAIIQDDKSATLSPATMTRRCSCLSARDAAPTTRGCADMEGQESGKHAEHIRCGKAGAMSLWCRHTAYAPRTATP